MALPGIKDGWHFFCAPRQVSAKLIASLRSKANASGVAGAAATLQLACAMEVYEFNVLEARFAKFQAQGAKGAPPKLDNRSSLASLQRATQLLKAAKAGKNVDAKTLYHLGVAMAVQGDVMAVNIFDELVTKFPKDPLSKESYLTLGEHYIERRDPQKAYRELKNALKGTRPATEAYARYKIAWLNFSIADEQKNAKKKQEAIQELVNLKKFLDRKSGRGNNKEKAKGSKEKSAEDQDGARKEDKLARLAEMIEEDVSEILAKQGDLAAAKKILSDLDAPQIYANLLERMANARLPQDPAGALSLFELSLREDPTRKEALPIIMAIVQLAAQKNDIKKITTYLQYMVGTFVREKSPWRNKNKDDKKLVAEAVKKTDEMLLEYAAAIDQEARKAGGDPALTAAARSLYELYLKTFKKSPQRAKVNIALGALMFLQKQYVQTAKTLYEAIKANPKEPAVRDALPIMVTAIQTAVDADKTNYQLAEAGTEKLERAIPPLRKLFADCLDLYVQLLPQDPNAAPMIFTSSGVYYDFGHYTEANKRFVQFFARHAQHELTKTIIARFLVWYVNQGDKKSIPLLNRIATMKPIIDAPEYAQLLKKAQERAKKVENEPAPSESDKDSGAAVAGKAKLKGGGKGKTQTTSGKGNKAKPASDDSDSSDGNASEGDASESE